MRTNAYAKSDMLNMSHYNKKPERMTIATMPPPRMTPDNYVYVSNFYCDCNDCVKYGCAHLPVVFVNPKVMHYHGDDLPDISYDNITSPPPPPASQVVKDPIMTPDPIYMPDPIIPKPLFSELPEPVFLKPGAPVRQYKRKESKPQDPVVIIRKRSLHNRVGGAIKRTKINPVSSANLAALLKSK